MSRSSKHPSLSFNLALPMVREASGDECRTPADCARLLGDIANADREFFTVLTLNTKYRVIDKHLVSIGIVDACLVHPREVFRAAISDNASALIVCHNHPSGDTSPSREDIKITRQLIEAGRIIDIEILDHVIIGRPNERNPQGFTSLRESGLVSFSAT